MSFTLTTDKISVTLDYNPSSLVNSTSKKIGVYVFNSGNDSVIDEGKNSDMLTLSGIIDNTTDTHTTIADNINTMLDSKDDVAVTGLPDSNLNTDYKIYSFSISKGKGNVNEYMYTISLERKYDSVS